MIIVPKLIVQCYTPKRMFAENVNRRTKLIKIMRMKRGRIKNGLEI